MRKAFKKAPTKSLRQKVIQKSRELRIAKKQVKKTKVLRKKLVKKVAVKKNTVVVEKKVVRKSELRKLKKQAKVIKKKMYTTESPKHRKVLREKLLKVQVLRGGKKFVESEVEKLRGKEGREKKIALIKKLQRETKDQRSEITKRVIRTEKVNKSALKRVKQIKREIKKAESPKKRKQLRSELAKVVRLGRKSCDVNRNMRDVAKGASGVISSLEKMLSLQKKVQKEEPEKAKRDNKKISELIKRQIEEAKMMRDKMGKSTKKCPCQKCGNCQKKSEDMGVQVEGDIAG